MVFFILNGIVKFFFGIFKFVFNIVYNSFKFVHERFSFIFQMLKEDNKTEKRIKNVILMNRKHIKYNNEI